MRYSTQLEHGKKIPLHDEEGFAGMRAAGRIAADTLDYITPFVKPGISTAKLDAMCEEFMRAAGAIPATIDYHGYKHASCISVNHVVTHGIPSESKILKVGDILNIDVTPKFNEWHGDTSRTFKVGAVSILANRLVNTAYEAMMVGINTVRPGATLGDVGAAIEAVAKAQGFSSVRDFCGHGVGKVFHDTPQVLHYGKAGTGIVLEPGMIFTIEPMLNVGSYQVKVLPDKWTTVTKDRSLSAQFEHSLAVTETGFEIFTLSALPAPSPEPLTGRLLARHRSAPEDALQQVAQAVLMQHGIRSDSVLRAERIAALTPPVACVVVLAEWLAYVDWEGVDSARYMNFDGVNALVQTELGLPSLARDNFELQRHRLVERCTPIFNAILPSFLRRSD